MFSGDVRALRASEVDGEKLTVMDENGPLTRDSRIRIK
jgi:hypothetical protein